MRSSVASTCGTADCIPKEIRLKPTTRSSSRSHWRHAVGVGLGGDLRAVREPELRGDRPRASRRGRPACSSVGVPPPRKTVDTGTSTVAQHPAGLPDLGDRGLGVGRTGRRRALAELLGGVGVEVAVAAAHRAERARGRRARTAARRRRPAPVGQRPSAGAGSPVGRADGTARHTAVLVSTRLAGERTLSCAASTQALADVTLHSRSGRLRRRTRRSSPCSCPRRRCA